MTVSQVINRPKLYTLSGCELSKGEMITVALAEKEFSVLASNFIQSINQALRTFVISGPLFYLNNLKVNCCYISTNATRRMSLLHPHIAPQSWTDTMIQLSVSNGFIDM